MFYYLDIDRQIKRITANKSFLKETDDQTFKNKNDEILCDITDGLLYKEILKSDIGDLIKQKQAFTFTINTDGISLSESSNLSMWPVYLAINEVNPEYRYCIENIIIAGKI